MVLAMLLKTHRDQCRTLRGNRTTVEAFSGISALSNIFVARAVKCKILGGGSFRGPSAHILQ